LLRNKRLSHEYYPSWWAPGLHIDSLLLSLYSEILVIAIFGAWRVKVEKNHATRRRVATLVSLVTLLWGVIPLLWPMVEPQVGTGPWAPGFPAVHVPGALTWFVWLGLIFLFGRRMDCSWCCPCVGIRETAGQPFRERTLRQPLAWALRHVKRPFFAAHVVYFVLLFIPGKVAETWFGTF